MTLITAENYCSKCFISFESRNEYSNHIQSKHLKSLIINTDKGNTIAFSRVGPSKFVCPTCYLVCENIQDILFHLLCEESFQSEFEKNLTNSSAQENNVNELNELSSIKTGNQSDYTSDNYSFLLTSNSSFDLEDKRSLDKTHFDINDEVRLIKQEINLDLDGLRPPKRFKNNFSKTNLESVDKKTPNTEKSDLNYNFSDNASRYATNNQPQVVSNSTRPPQHRLNRVITDDLELENNPIKRYIFEIISRYYSSRIISYKITNRLYCLGPNDAINLSTLLTWIAPIDRPDKSSQLEMIEELSVSNLFIINRPKRNTFQIRRNINLFLENEAELLPLKRMGQSNNAPTNVNSASVSIPPSTAGDASADDLPSTITSVIDSFTVAPNATVSTGITPASIVARSVSPQDKPFLNLNDIYLPYSHNNNESIDEMINLLASDQREQNTDIPDNERLPTPRNTGPNHQCNDQ